MPVDARQQTGDPRYQAALNYLWGRINYERAPLPRRQRGLRLDRVRQLLSRIGDPQDALRVIHVAGTKGKGSTSAMLASVLSEAGYHTGLYTSPHLQQLEERIRIDGQQCSPEEFTELIEALRGAVDALDEQAQRTGRNCRPTFFEIVTAMALLQFAQRSVDVAVIEVGLGGRLDSTNVVRPEVSVITTISFDHVRQLGNTLSDIAREKAGIIKHEIPVVSGVTDAEPHAMIEQVAAAQSAPLMVLGRDFSYTYRAPTAVDLDESSNGLLDYDSNFASEPAQRAGLRLGMLGRHQAHNAAVALATLDQLRARGWRIPAAAVRCGLERTSCPARIEIVSRQPTVVLDAAHNVASVRALLSVLDESFAAERRILLFGATGDKDVGAMLQLLLPGFESIILTKCLDNPRTVELSALQALAESASARLAEAPRVFVCQTPEAAWQQCRSMVTPEHLVCVTGSFFLAAEMRGPILAPPVVLS